MTTNARTDFTHAFVLRLVDYGEADRIVTLLTERYGKVSALARGARRSRKRFGASLEPFAKIEVEVALGRGEIGRLAQARIVRVFPKILASLEKMTLAGRGLEWSRLGLPQRLPEPEVVVLIEQFLGALDEGEEPDVGLLAGFLVRLADALGFSPRFDACGVCGRVAPADKPGMFDPALGGLVCRACATSHARASRAIRLSAATRRHLVTALGGSEWTTTARSWPANVRGESMDALDALLRSHVTESSESPTARTTD